MSHDSLAEYKVHKIQELKRQNRRDEARQLLEQVSKQVQPILRKRQWTVPSLKEFLPKNPNLLGLNVNGRRGTTTEIRIRLRYQHSPDSFYPYEDVLGTMLHEITHNVQGPHDAKFYSILDELTKECEEFMAKGITGTGIGFDGPSNGRLGAHSWIPQHNLDPEAMKAAQLKVAQKRAAQQAIMPRGPQRLGGRAIKSMTPREAAAAAAERRSRDNLWCPSAALAAGEKVVIDLVDDGEDEGDPPSRVGPADAPVPPKTAQAHAGAAAWQDHRQVTKPDAHGRGSKMGQQPIKCAAVQPGAPQVPHPRHPGSAVSAVHRNKAGEAAAARAQAAKGHHNRDTAGPHPTAAGSGSQQPCRPRSGADLHDRTANYDQLGAAAWQGAAERRRGPGDGRTWQPTATAAMRAAGGANEFRNNGENDNDDDDDDDIIVVGVCSCGGGIAVKDDLLQESQANGCPQSSSAVKRRSQSAGDSDIYRASRPSLAAWQGEADRQAHKAQRHDAGSAEVSGNVTSCGRPGQQQNVQAVAWHDSVQHGSVNERSLLADCNGREPAAKQRDQHRMPEQCTGKQEEDCRSLIDLT